MCACVCKYTKISVYMYYSVPMVVHSMLKKTHKVLGTGKVKLWVGGRECFMYPLYFSFVPAASITFCASSFPCLPYFSCTLSAALTIYFIFLLLKFLASKFSV